MGAKQGKPRSPKKGRGEKKKSILIPRRYVAAGGILLLVSAGLLAYALNRPRYTWYVEEGLEEAWEEALENASPPRLFKKELVSLETGAAAPEGARGFIITTRRAQSGEPVTLYPRLSFTLEYEGAHVLALDPWMVFRNHQFPSLSRGRVDSVGGGEGSLLIAGQDPVCLRAWTARLIQESPGVFPPEQELWESLRTSLFTNNRFRRGAATFTWQDVWFFLLGNDPAWAYAPISRVRELPNYRSNILEATVFPEPAGADRFGLQARILWAIPVGNRRTLSKLEPALEWLKDDETQTIIADAFRWIPADPDGRPFDPAAMSARIAWLTCSYVWEDNEW
jgi:hypothetical protein